VGLAYLTAGCPLEWRIPAAAASFPPTAAPALAARQARFTAELGRRIPGRD